MFLKLFIEQYYNNKYHICMQQKPKRPADINKKAKTIVGIAIGENTQSPKTLPKPQLKGRAGGLIGGHARARVLSSRKRLEIAKKAANKRWKKMMKWEKELTQSDAQRETEGAKMPFLRFTKGDAKHDHTTWFRDVFFASLDWTPDTSKQGRDIEEARISIKVKILGENLGLLLMRLDHDPMRADNHNAPTTHLHYDNKTRGVLESKDLSGCVVALVSDDGNYSLEIFENASAAES